MRSNLKIREIKSENPISFPPRERYFKLERVQKFHSDDGTMSATVIDCSLLFGVACSRISVSDDDRKNGRATSGTGADPSFSLPDPRDHGAWYLGEGRFVQKMKF